MILHETSKNKRTDFRQFWTVCIISMKIRSWMFNSRRSCGPRSLQADSHITCRAHAAHMPFSCHAVPLRVENVSFPFDLHSEAVSDSHLPCHAQAIFRTCCSSQGHGTERPWRDGLWATCPRSVSSGYDAEFHEVCYQTHTSLRCRWPVWNQTRFVMDEEKSGRGTLQKRRFVTLWDQQFGYFRLSCGLSRRTQHYRSRTGARNGMCELKHGMAGKGMGAAWTRHAMCESALRRGSAAAALLGLWVRIQPGSWMSVSFECCVFSGRGLCVCPITRPEESYHVLCFWMWSWSLNNEEVLTH